MSNTEIAEREEQQSRIAELSSALERMTELRDNAETNANALFDELEFMRKKLSAANAILDRLRLHIQQGVEL